MLGYFGFIHQVITADECDKVGVIQHVNLNDSPGVLALKPVAHETGVLALRPIAHEMYMAYENRTFGVISSQTLIARGVLVL